jgi:hypothetical protein
VALSDAEILDRLETVIARRLDGDAYTSYSEGEQSFSGTPLDQLLKMRDDLRQRIAAQAGAQFRLARPQRPS